MSDASYQMLLRRDCHRLRAILGAELVEDRGHVKFRRPLADAQTLRDLLVRFPARHERQYFALARRESLTPIASDHARGDARIEKRLRSEERRVGKAARSRTAAE